MIRDATKTEHLARAARRETELQATIDKLKAQVADLERQCAERQARGDNANGQNNEGPPSGIFDLVANMPRFGCLLEPTGAY